MTQRLGDNGRVHRTVFLLFTVLGSLAAETISDGDRAYLISHLEMTREFVRDTTRGLTNEQWLYQTRLNACGTECATWMSNHLETTGTMYDGDDGFPATAPVDSFPAGKSADGIVNMAGNVMEWTADWYGPYTEAPAVDPKGPAEGKERVARGGAYNGDFPDWPKPAFRWKTLPAAYNHAIGFRCAAAADKL
jgi:formylglycine-generating enzyme required for sulfatase activity